MSSLWKRILLQIVILGLCAMAIWPPDTKIRLGRDLAGGVSLVYTVQIADNESGPAVMSQMVAALKDRLDPQGVLEIQINSVGRDRIEIQMPLARQEVKDLRAEFEASLEKLGEFRPTKSRLTQVFDMPAAERDAKLAEIAGGPGVMLDKLKEAARLHDEVSALDKKLAAMPPEAPAADRDPIVAARAELNPKLTAIREELQQSVLPPDMVRRVLQLPTAEKNILSEDGKTPVKDPSQQAVKVEELLARYPLRKAELSHVVDQYQAYAAKRTTLDDPQDLIRLLRGAGELTFRIPVLTDQQYPEAEELRRELQEKGPTLSRRPDARWFKINQISNWYESVGSRNLLRMSAPRFFEQRKLIGEAYLDGYYILCWDTPDAKLTRETGEWAVASAHESRDEVGKPTISFTMDNRGAVYLGELTNRNVGRPMAVLLDDEVYTAPTLQSAISRSGQITGVDSEQERQYVIKVLTAGALQAKLSPEPISESILSPSLGLDNLERGLNAGYISFGLCAVFLIGYYFFCGVVSTIALAVNTFLLIGMMAFNRAAFTLPGIAGVILAFAMAVDANVLIFERMREEITFNGVSLKDAVRLGYNRAMSAIIDGNLTHLQVCLVLFIFGTAEIRGFAVTMSIGVVTTLFAQLVFTRLCFDIALKMGWRKTSMLPMAIPAVQKAFTVNVDWMRLRKVFYAICIVSTLAAGIFIARRNKEMFDTEFRGGTQVVLQLKRNAAGEALTLPRSEIEDRFQKVAETDEYPRDLRNVSVQVINPRPDQTSDTFRLTTLLADTPTVRKAVLSAFGDVIERRTQLKFKGAEIAGGEAVPAYVINRSRLGDIIGRPEAAVTVEEYRGGVATVLDNIEPPVSLRELRERITGARSRPDVVGGQRSLTDVIPLTGDDKAVTSAVVLSLDAEHSAVSVTDEWAKNVRETEWQVIRSALTEDTQLLSVNTFSPAIAKTFVAQAILCVVIAAMLIIVFIWVRFNSIRFSIAAIVPTLMDCFIAVGLIAAAEVVYDTAPGVAHALGMVPFKIDLNVVASVLTVLGYSINDKIVLLDRIRENRGKSMRVTREIVNDSVNQCLSRTLLTGTTTILSTLVLYIMGGDALKPFAYSLGLGIVVGTLSSIMLAAPMVCGAGMKASDEEPSGTGTGADLAPVV